MEVCVFDFHLKRGSVLGTDEVHLVQQCSPEVKACCKLREMRACQCLLYSHQLPGDRKPVTFMSASEADVFFGY